MRRRTSVRLLAAGILLVTGATVTPAYSVDDGTTAVRAPAVRTKAPAGALDATGYWTAEKMRNAIPADLPTGTAGTPAKQGTSSGVASRPVAPRAGYKLANDVVPSTAGKLFFTDNGLNYVCSASTINNSYKNLIITAGHCVHSGQGGGWHSNIVFAPAYYNGQSGYGLWNWSQARTFNSWISSSDFTHDQAFVTLQQRNGANLIDAVGGNGLVWGNGQSQAGTRIWGWPAEAPYNGEVPYYCDGTTYAWGGSDAALTCSMNGGASGGPWLKDRIDANLGYVFAVTSRRTTSGTPTLLSTPNTADVKTMFDQMTT
ncbi:trypsin-like serine peptidase [Kribbella sp. NPDC059898]|uniref:trypsin-like serine peptidase n=1 Tax=Kribbella sp. NPDC059898 TaxID=3346995 RepID=UPI00365AE660